MDPFQGKIDGHLDEPSIASGGTPFAVHVDRNGSQLGLGGIANATCTQHKTHRIAG